MKTQIDNIYNISAIEQIDTNYKVKNTDFVYKLNPTTIFFNLITIHKNGWYYNGNYIGKITSGFLIEKNSYVESGIVYHNPYIKIKWTSGKVETLSNPEKCVLIDLVNNIMKKLDTNCIYNVHI